MNIRKMQKVANVNKTIKSSLPTQGWKSYLTEDLEGINTPIGLNAVLYPHQMVVVKAMLDLEEKRIIEVIPNDFQDSVTSNKVFIETCAIVLAEPFGSGKTLEILAMILVRPIPRAVPVAKAYHADNISTTYRSGKPSAHFMDEIRRRFPGENALLRPNVIIVGSSVLVQWQNAIHQYTKLRVFAISDAATLTIFFENFTKDRRWVSTYDIILIKNGQAASKFRLEGESSKVELRHIVDAVGKITWECCWSRVFYDDYDTINIPSTTTALNSLFSVYVSATKNQYNRVTKMITYPNMIAALRDRGSTIAAAASDKLLVTNCAIACTTDFVEASTSVTVIDQYQYVYQNPDDVYIGLLGMMGDNEINNIVEMLNGDAIETAAEAMGIKTNNIASIFEKVLDQKYERYIYDQLVLDRIADAAKELGYLERHEDGKQHSKGALDAITAQLIKSGPLPDFHYHSHAAVELLANLKAEYTIRFNEDSIAINRVMDNVREGACQVCCLPLDEGGVFITKCCGLILCQICGVTGCKLSKQHDYKTGKTMLMGKCANCMSPVIPSRDLIFLDKSFDIESLLTAKGNEKSDEPDEISPIMTPESTIKNPKLRALLAIIRGEVPEDRKIVHVEIPNLLHGSKNIPDTDDKHRRVVVFASYDETLRNIEKFLVENNITFMRLEGTSQKKADTTTEFENGGAQVLLINSQQQCAGLNLQFGSDLIFFHSVLNQHVLGQIAGRFQRIGRKSNAKFHFLCYPNEKKIISRAGDIPWAQ